MMRFAKILSMAALGAMLAGPAAAGDGLRGFFSKSTATSNSFGSVIGQAGGSVLVDVLLAGGLVCYEVADIDRDYEPWGQRRIDGVHGADLTVSLAPSECRGIQENRIVFQVPHPAYTDILNMTFVTGGRAVDFQRVQIQTRSRRVDD
ncbi:MAG: hypothetical protein AAFX39_03345 [Pseudomonadota bacterium]